MSLKPTQQLINLGQSLWYDNISRTMLRNGELRKLIDDFGVRGMTSNPTIFDNAISKSDVYDSVISAVKTRTPDAIFEEIAVGDIGEAADMLLPIYKSSNGEDGFVSIEVSPLLAADTAGTIEEAKRLHKKLNRANIMIKVPGTAEGIPAVQALLEEGISVNITLLFGVKNYEAVAQTYVTAMRNRVKRGLPVDKIRSVASFFVSRVDSSIDKELNGIVEKNKSSDPAKAERAQSLLGQFGIANSKVAYKKYQDIFEGAAFADLRTAGCAVQRPLWASTSTKNPTYRDVMYVEQLIGKNTVNTMPHETVLAFADHGVAKADTVTAGIEQALKLESELVALGIDVPAVIHALQVEGVKKFADSFAALNNTIAKKLQS